MQNASQITKVKVKMISENNIQNSTEMSNKSKGFSFSIASILGETQCKSTEELCAPPSYVVPQGHSTPKPDTSLINMYENTSDSSQQHHNTFAQNQEDILKQSWDIAFNGASFPSSPNDNTSGNDASPNTSLSSDTQSLSGPSPTPSVGEGRHKKARTSFTSKQLRELETRYAGVRYIAAADRTQLARSLGLSDQQVKTWFQNRRMKEKRHIQDNDQSPINKTPSPHSLLHPAMIPAPVPSNCYAPVSAGNASVPFLQVPMALPRQPTLYQPLTHDNGAIQVPQFLHTVPMPSTQHMPNIAAPMAAQMHVLPEVTSHYGAPRQTPIISISAPQQYQSAFTKVSPATSLNANISHPHNFGREPMTQSRIPGSLLRPALYSNLSVPTPVFM